MWKTRSDFLTAEEVKNLLRKLPQFEIAFSNLKTEYRSKINPMIDTLDFVDPKFFDAQAAVVKIQIKNSNSVLLANENAEFSIF